MRLGSTKCWLDTGTGCAKGRQLGGVVDKTGILLALIAASPIGLPLLIRALSLRIYGRAQTWMAWLSGIACPAFLGWSIYRNEGPDSDALVFFVLVVAMAAAISIATIMVAEAISARE
jgi:hypothetical protein